jgi:putative DNA primase/helicase
MENLKMEPTDWVWDASIARGEIHLIAGAPESGKTTIALAFAATLSSGWHWPNGTVATAGNVVIWTGEDNPAKTIKPRLVQMGADPKRIWIVQGKRDENGKLIPFNPATDLPLLAAIAKEIEGGVDMLIIDPIVSVVVGRSTTATTPGIARSCNHWSTSPKT